MIFIVNFIKHHYQFYWNVERDGSQKAQIYRNCERTMKTFLKNFLLEKNILVALEEGGTGMNIFEALSRHGNDKTFLQEVINSITDRKIIHEFVDINKDQVEELQTNSIATIEELQDSKASLRDEYIAKAAIKIFSSNDRKNGLLLCADKHFSGVKEYFELNKIQVIADKIDRFKWYTTIE